MSSVVSSPSPGQISVTDCYSVAWSRLWQQPVPLILVALVFVLFNVPSNMLTHGEAGVLRTLAALAYQLLVLWPVTVGFGYVAIKAARGVAVDVGDLFAGFRVYVNAVLVSLLVFVIVVVGLVLLIVPGIILGCRLCMAPYLVVDRQMDAIAAIQRSWEMTRGNGINIFLIFLLAILVCVAGLLALCVGILPAMVLVYVAIAVAYDRLSGGTATASA